MIVRSLLTWSRLKNMVFMKRLFFRVYTTCFTLVENLTKNIFCIHI